MHLSDNALSFTNVIAASPSRQSAWGGGALGGWGGKSGAFDHLPVGYAPPIVAANQARCNETDVGVAAEQHRREMEERLREILGDAGLDGSKSCPLCVEEMDATDLAFMPCDCGYQVCLLCFHRIQEEGSKQCPACRTEYDVAKIKMAADEKAEPAPAPAAPHDPPSHRISGRVAGRGWESVSTRAAAPAAAPAAKPARKAAGPPLYAGVDPRVERMLLQCHEAGALARGELDDRVLAALKGMRADAAEASLAEFLKKDMSRVRNKSAFLNGIIARVMQEELSCDSADGALPRSADAWQQGRVNRVLTMADVAGLPHAALLGSLRC